MLPEGVGQLDVTNDGVISPLDALTVVNELSDAPEPALSQPAVDLRAVQTAASTDDVVDYVFAGLDEDKEDKLENDMNRDSFHQFLI